MIIKLIWPAWLFLAFQIPWNILAMTVHGNFKSSLGNWMYSRNCGWSSACDGGAFIWYVWCAIGIIALINTIAQITLWVRNART